MLPAGVLGGNFTIGASLFWEHLFVYVRFLSVQVVIFVYDFCVIVIFVYGDGSVLVPRVPCVVV